MEKEIFDIDEIGNIARLIDTEMTLFERIKIKKTTVLKLIAALLFYFLVMYLFSIIL